MDYEPTPKEYAESYQPLFNILSAHGLIPLQSEMDEVIRAVEQVKELQERLFYSECDVENCEFPPDNQGGCWNDTGYWCVCWHHSQKFRNGEQQPKMKDEAIERENSRDKVTGFLPTRAHTF